MHTVDRNHVNLLFTRKGRFAHVRQPNGPEYHCNLVFLDDLFDALPGIWCEFDTVCLLLEGLACLY